MYLVQDFLKGIYKKNAFSSRVNLVINELLDREGGGGGGGGGVADITWNSPLLL